MIDWRTRHVVRPYNLGAKVRFFLQNAKQIAEKTTIVAYSVGMTSRVVKMVYS